MTTGQSMQPAPSSENGWVTVCRYDDIVPDTGVCALVDGAHVAVFRIGNDEAQVFAIGNVDPRAHASVLSRGIVGSLGERIVVASPLYKHHFDLRTGECLEEPSWSVDALAARVVNGDVMVRRAGEA